MNADNKALDAKPLIASSMKSMLIGSGPVNAVVRSTVMSRRPKFREQDFPPPGTVFAARTRDGRFSAGRVLCRQFHGGAQAALVAGTPWLGDELPSLDLPELRKTLIRSHHNWKNDPEVFWVHDPMPPDFIIVGPIELSPNDLAATSYVFTGWQSVPIQALTQWRWDHDRESLLQDEARQAAEQAEAQRQLNAARAELMRTLTLDSLVDRPWFATWEETDANLPLHECRSLIAKLVNDLRAVPKLTLGVVKKHVKQSVKDFNRLDAEHHFIATIEREDLCEAYEHILCAAKFPQAVGQIDQWRDW